MPEHDLKLDDQKHRTIKLNTELCDTADTGISVKVVYKLGPDGNFTNYLVIKSLHEPLAFGDKEIPASGFKIPPQVPES